jgi:hypothetical protein
MINLVFSTLGRTYYCAYDERVAAKGPNEIGSLLQKVVAMERQRLVDIGGELRHLILWVDSARGQSWNGILMRVLSDMVTPGSPVYIAGLRRIDLKCCVMGYVRTVHATLTTRQKGLLQIAGALVHRHPYCNSRLPCTPTLTHSRTHASAQSAQRHVPFHRECDNFNKCVGAIPYPAPRIHTHFCPNPTHPVRRHSYRHCDRSIVPVKRHARTVVGGIVASFKSQVPEGYKNRTWEECVAKARTENKGYHFLQVEQESLKDFKAYYENPDYVLHSKK